MVNKKKTRKEKKNFFLQMKKKSWPQVCIKNIFFKRMSRVWGGGGLKVDKPTSTKKRSLSNTITFGICHNTGVVQTESEKKFFHFKMQFYLDN
jgi:hypothetical protein